MCGICGIVTLGGAPRPDSGGRGSAVTAMMGALMHRGPDESGIHDEQRAILGATRLAIRGLAGGHQPIRDLKTGVTVVCNGEIDNGRELRAWLESRGRRVEMPADVAVLPGLYVERGERFVEDLTGAFAVAIWDPREALLLLARDRAGERPLFYCTEEDSVRFATEIAALATDLSLRLTPDGRALRWYLRFGSFMAPLAPFVEVRKVAPGEVVTFRGGASGIQIERRRYWRWPVGGRTPDSSAPSPLPRKDSFWGASDRRSALFEPNAALETFDRIFREAVWRQSEAEVDYGVFLSGGIDSSLVAAVARRLRPERPLTAYTLRFGEPSYDEGDAASRVASLLGCAQVPIWVEAKDLPEGISTLVRMVGEPLADPAWVPTALLARRAAQDVKLCLVGEGADELFGGYPTYLGAIAASVFAGWPGPVKALVRRIVDLWPPSDKKVTLSFLLKRFVAGAEMDGIVRHYLWTSSVSPELLVRLGVPAPEVPPGPVPPEWVPGSRRAEEPVAPGGPSLLDLVQRIDLETFLAEGLLTKADRAGMQSALELRAPFLDSAVLEFAASLPPEERVRRFTTKVFLKRYAQRYLPQDVIYRKKRGLSVPLSRWFRGPLRAWAEERLGDPCLEKAGVRPAASLELLREHERQIHDHARALWTLLVLVEWLRWAGERAAPALADPPDEQGSVGGLRLAGL